MQGYTLTQFECREVFEPGTSWTQISNSMNWDVHETVGLQMNFDFWNVSHS